MVITAVVEGVNRLQKRMRNAGHVKEIGILAYPIS